MSIESIYCSFTPRENVDFFHLKSESENKKEVNLGILRLSVLISNRAKNNILSRDKQNGINNEAITVHFRRICIPIMR